MIAKASFTERPESIKYMVLPSGDADLWMRKNIAEVVDPETNMVSYEADEAYMRTKATEAEIAANFEGWFETASAWEPPVPEKEPETENERIVALEEDVASLKKANADLTKQNAVLQEELQATKIILGVE